MKAFIYTLSNPITSEVRYVGKTINPASRFHHHRYSKENTHKSKWINFMIKNSCIPIMDIIDEVQEIEWQFWEQHYISLYRSWGFNLTNADTGGLGGGRISEETRRKLSLSHTGKPNKSKGIKRKPLTEEHKRKISEYGKGRKKSLEQRIKMANSNKGQKRSFETRERMKISNKGKNTLEGNRKTALAHTGMKRSAETCLSISLAKKGWIPSVSTRQKMSIAKIGKPTWNKGKPHSDSHKNKLKEAWIKRKLLT